MLGLWDVKLETMTFILITYPSTFSQIKFSLESTLFFVGVLICTQSRYFRRLKGLFNHSLESWKSSLDFIILALVGATGYVNSWQVAGKCTKYCRKSDPGEVGITLLLWDLNYSEKPSLIKSVKSVSEAQSFSPRPWCLKMLHLIRYQRLCFSTWTFWRNTIPTSQHDRYCFVFPVAVPDKFCPVSCQKFLSKRTVLPPRIIFSVQADPPVPSTGKGHKQDCFTFYNYKVREGWTF